LGANEREGIMFDSLDGGYIPICLTVLLFSWFVSSVKETWRRILLSVLVPVSISFLWYVIPDFFRSVPERRDPTWFSWGLVATMAWSIAAIPVSIISVYIFVVTRKKATNEYKHITSAQNARPLSKEKK
jgi:chromate transport protein ChrA